MTATFRGFERVTPVPLAGAQTASGRLRLTLTLTGTIAEVAIGARPLAPVPVPVDVFGPGDVAGLAPGAVVRSSPADGAVDVDGDYCVFVEFRSADLPWRYSPSPQTGDGVKPWLALVAGVEGEELGIDPDGTLWMSPRLTRALDPARAACWAHTQGDAGGPRTARLLCPRELPPLAACLAAVVPLVGGGWTPGRPARRLPVLYRVRFRTNDQGTFEDLAAALHPVPRPPGLGEAQLRANPGAGQPGDSTATVRGALAPRGAPAEPFDDPSVLSRTEALLEPPPGPGQPVLGPPRYSAPFAYDPAAPWAAEVDTDPRHRAAAGLGTRLGVEWQDRITAAAGTRLGETHLAAALLRHVTAGTSLARRTEARTPAEAYARLAFYGPALGNLRTTDATALEHICPPERALPPALLCSAASHLVRASGPTAKASADAAGVADPGRILEAAAECPEPPRAPVKDQDVSRGRVDLEQLYHGLRDLGETVDFPDLELLVIDGPGEEGTTFCEPVPPGWPRDVVDALDGAFRPEGVPVDRVVSRIGGLHERYDVPLEVRPDLDLPTWDWLRDRAPEWLLPRAGLIPRDGVVALRTDRAFISAFLVGASRQAVAELRWRGVPVSAGAMPMRTFWQNVASPENPPPMVDLVQPSSWPSVPLAGLPGPRGTGDDLVLVLRSDLVRRYPDTLVYLAPAVDTGGGERDADLQAPVEPAFCGRIGDDVWFFGFPVPPSALADHMLVLEEPDRGPRFHPPSSAEGAAYRVTPKRYDDAGHALPDAPSGPLTDGGAYAAAAYAAPIRAVCDGRLLLDPGEQP